MKFLNFFFFRSLISSIYFNFKFLPFNQAIKFPFVVKGKLRIIRSSGSINLYSSSLKFGAIKLGFQGSDMFSNQVTVIDLAGNLNLYGDYFSFGVNSLIRVEKGASLNIKNDFVLGANSILFCENDITIQEKVITSWSCQIIDTDTHSLRNRINNTKFDRSKPIFIGMGCWLGNNVTINKGTKLPNFTIIASHTLCNKDYTINIGEFSLLGGIPAKLLKSDIEFVGDKIK